MPRNSDDFVPPVTNGFTVIDGRQTHRCVTCGAYVEYRDKTKHRAYHQWLAETRDLIITALNRQEALIDTIQPPF